MNRTVQTAQQKVRKLKILECTIEEDMDSRLSHYSYSACGSGGGCSGGGLNKTARAMHTRSTL